MNLLLKAKKGFMAPLMRAERSLYLRDKKNRRKKILGEGYNGRVIVKNAFTVRKEKRRVPWVIGQSYKKEGRIQKRAAKAGVAPWVGKIKDDSFTMQRIRSSTVESRLNTANPKQQKRLARTFTKKLNKLHDAGIDHRDLHLRNAVVTRRGKMMIVDYGKAKDYGRPLTTKERRGDYRKVVKRYKGRQYEPFRSEVKKTYQAFR